MYELLRLFHILSAMVWVGGGFVLVAVERHSHKVGGRAGVARTMRELEWVDDWIFTPAPLLVVVTGIAMVAVDGAWAFSQPWIYLTLGLIVVEFVVGYRDVNNLRAGREKGTESPEYKAALKAYLRFAPIAIGMLGVIVVLMVFKPGV